jgi:hypothetical protein
MQTARSPRAPSMPSQVNKTSATGYSSSNICLSVCLSVAQTARALDRRTERRRGCVDVDAAQQPRQRQRRRPRPPWQPREERPSAPWGLEPARWRLEERGQVTPEADLQAIGYTWSCLACRIGHCVPIEECPGRARTRSATRITETNGKQLVLFGMQNRTLRPYLTG